MCWLSTDVLSVDGVKSKFGPNGAQVERFLEAARDLTFEDALTVAAARDREAVWDAQGRIMERPRSASRYSAIDSAARKLLSVLLQSYPSPQSSAEVGPALGFGSMLVSAVFGLASRGEVDDETVGLIVDPFAERLGFEWRSWGVGSGAEGGHG